MIFDLGQNPVNIGGRTRGRFVWPVVLTTTIMAMLTASNDQRGYTLKLATASEHFQAMGFDFYQRVSPGSPLASAFVRAKTSRARQIRMAGNSMHCATQAAWMMYMLGHIVDRSSMFASLRSISSARIDLDESDDDA